MLMPQHHHAAATEPATPPATHCSITSPTTALGFHQLIIPQHGHAITLLRSSYPATQVAFTFPLKSSSPPPGHVHPPAAVHPSILRLSALQRLGVRGGLIALIWAAAFWAMR